MKIAAPIAIGSHAASVRIAAPLRREASELRHDLGVMDDRPGDQLREEEDEQDEVPKAPGRRLAEVNVGQIGDLLKGEEGDAERQDDAQQLHIRTARPH